MEYISQACLGAVSYTHLKRIGGDDKLILLTEQEMDDIFEADVEEVILLLDYDRETIRQKRNRRK